MLILIFLLIIFFCIGMSLRTLFLPNAVTEKFISWESFVYLLFIYTTTLLGFGLIYFLLLQNGIPILIENGAHLSGSVLYHLQTSIYFSGVTLFSIGFGDVSPVGIGRLITIIEGIIGYTIPASFVVRTVIDLKRENG